MRTVLALAALLAIAWIPSEASRCSTSQSSDPSAIGSRLVLGADSGGPRRTAPPPPPAGPLDFDGATRGRIRVIATKIPHWHRLRKHPARNPTAAAHPYRGDFMAVLAAINRTSRRWVHYNELFNLARGVLKSGASALHWIADAVRSADADVVRLGAALAGVLPLDANADAVPALLLDLVAAQFPTIVDAAQQHQIAHMGVRQAATPVLVDALKAMMRSSVNIARIHQLISVMWPNDVEKVMGDLGYLDAQHWARCFTPFIQDALLSERIASLDAFFRDLTIQSDRQLRFHLFLMTACSLNDPVWLFHFLWDGLILEKVPSVIRDLMLTRCSPFYLESDSDTLQVDQARFDWMLDLMTEEVALMRFFGTILPQCLKLLFTHDINEKTSRTQFTVASSWFRYVIGKVDLNAKTFWDSMPPQYGSYYRPISYLGVLIQICPRVVFQHSRVPISAYQLLCDLIYYIGNAELSPRQQRNYTVVSYLLISAVLRYRDGDLDGNIPELHNVRMHDSAQAFLQDAVGDTPPFHSIIGALRGALQPAAPLSRSPLNYGPVIGNDPAAIGITDPRPLSVLALVHDPCLPHCASLRGLIRHLDATDPMPVRILTWMASEPRLYRKFLGAPTASEAARMESGNFFFSLADCIEPDPVSAPSACALCLDDFSESKRPVRLSCGDRFCLDCIGEWIGLRPACPICLAVHAHRLTRERFRVLVAARTHLPDGWSSWKQL